MRPNLLPLVGVLLTIGSVPLHSATWDGGLSHANFTVNDLWSTPNNWVDGVPASGLTTDVIFALSGIRTTATQNVGNPFTLRSMTFAPGANVTAVSGLQVNVAPAGTITQNSSIAVTLNHSIGWSGSGTVSGSGNGPLTLNGSMSGSATLKFAGSAGGQKFAVNVGAANTYAGTTLIGESASGFAPVEVTAGNNTAFGSSQIQFINGNIIRSANGPRSIANQLGFVSSANGLPSVYIFGAGDNLTLKGSISVSSAAKALQVDNAVTTFDGDISGVAPLTKTGAGQLVLNGTNTSATGGWTINGGSLKLGSLNALAPSSVVVNTPDGFDTSGQFNTVVSSLTGTGSVVLGNNTLRVGVFNASSSFPGRIAASAAIFGNLRKIGTGTFTSTGIGSVFNGLQVDSGTFDLNGGTISLGSGGVVVGSAAPPATGKFSGGAVVTSMDPSNTSNVISGPPSTTMFVEGAGTRWSSGFQVVIAGGNGPNFSDGFLRLRTGAVMSGTFLLSGAGGPDGVGSLIIETGGKANYEAGVVGFVNGSVGEAFITGAGSEWNMNTSLGMGGFNTELVGGKGTLTIADNGIVRVNGTTIFWTPGSRIEAHGGQFITNALGTNSLTDATVALSDPDENTSAMTVGGGGATSTFPGKVTNGTIGPGGLTKVGGGTVTFTGPLSYTGVTRVNGGRLVITQPFPFATITQVNAGATLEFTGTWGTNTFSQTTIASGGNLTVTNSGTLKGAVTNNGLIEVGSAKSLTFTGNFVNNGRLRIKGGGTFAGTGPFVNNGIIDIITAGGFTPPPGFVNNGQIIDRTGVITSIQKVATLVTISSPKLYGGHLYVLQGSDSLETPFVTLGIPFNIPFDQPFSTDLGEIVPQRFYRWKVD